MGTDHEYTFIVTYNTASGILAVVQISSSEWDGERNPGYNREYSGQVLFAKMKDEDVSKEITFDKLCSRVSWKRGDTEVILDEEAYQTKSIKYSGDRLTSAVEVPVFRKLDPFEVSMSAQPGFNHVFTIEVPRWD